MHGTVTCCIEGAASNSYGAHAGPTGYSSQAGTRAGAAYVGYGASHAPSRAGISTPAHCLHTLRLRKKTPPFYFRNNLVRCRPIFPIVCRNVPQEI